MSPQSKYYLSVGCIFRNESDSILEWVQHYIHHGIQHLYMINDSSTDDSVAKIQPYIDAGWITLFDGNHWERYLGRQRDMYNRFLLPHLRETQWLIIVDMDEYLWSQVEIDLKKIIRQMPEGLTQIQFAHTLFGSSGHIFHPSGGIVRNFTWRSRDRPTEDGIILKYMVNSDYDFESLNIHYATPKNREYMEEQYFQKFFAPWFILNHYCCQSREFWRIVKCTRGDGDHYLQRTMADFKKFDRNEVEDLELAEQNKTIERCGR